MPQVNTQITVGMKGIISCLTPFDLKINKQLIYECIAVETIKGMLSRGTEVLDDIYTPNGLTNSDYDLDYENEIRIITLQSSEGEVISFPENYLLTLPDPNGVMYRCVILGISLSAIPNDLDLSNLKSDISDLAFDTFGVRSAVKEISMGEPSILTTAEHNAIEASRLNNIVNNVSSRNKIIQLQNTNAELTQKITILENYIKTLIA